VFAVLQDARFDELAFMNNQESDVVLKPEPDSDDSCSGGMVIDQLVQSPDSTSPVFNRPTASASAHYSNTDDTASEASSFSRKRPFPVDASGSSKRFETEDDFQSIASSASELKMYESRRKNNQASKRSRSNKKSRDHYNEHELQQLEDHHSFLVRKTDKLVEIRDQLRSLVADRVRR
jgi:Basic region leucine zipper